ncbi:hypothetical protein Sjap_016369 [Stephania japonica]|uniref:RING-type domain-containing protein n=1 Tax=Stephania japonica TaxID=461633 RepID=A0AAP0IMW2_9MAGN
MPTFLSRKQQPNQIREMWQNQPNKSSYQESLEALEADIQHANSLAAALPGDYGGECLQMRLSYSPIAPFFLYLIEWIDFSCTDTLTNYLGLLHIIIYKVHVDGVTTMSTHERRATLREFYAVIYPYLQQLESELAEFEDGSLRSWCTESDDSVSDGRRNVCSKNGERDDECGICMEACTQMVLPNCGHSMCISCFRDWNLRSQSCPFCRGNLKMISSKDLWVLTSSSDVVDQKTIAKENLRHFFLYIDHLPLVMSDIVFFMHDYMI